jgi:hypothetical protein
MVTMATSLAPNWSVARPNRDHQALLRRVQRQELGDLHAERAKQHPDHEADVEIQE